VWGLPVWGLPVWGLPVWGLPVWALPVPLAVVAAALVGLRLAHARFADSRLAAGLAVLGDPWRRRRVALLGLLVVALTLLRLLLILWACGMDHGPAAVALTYIASSVLGVLPIGPASSLGAAVVTAGAATAEATAAGVVISATSVAAVLLYATLTTLNHSQGGLGGVGSDQEG
jgi:hypothetical protein